ncbi:MAG: hypothetical protein ACI3XG_11970 [Faecousia sp.]
MKRKILTLWGLGAAAVLTALVLTTATYAWFTANREVGTDRVSARTGSSSLELQISRSGGANFSPEAGNEAALKTQDTPLMPVSTADLKTFVYNPMTVDGYAQDFLPTQDESLYYHDTIYLRALATGMPEGTKVALYLDNTDNPVVETVEGELLTAARLGMTFDGAAPVIIALSEENVGAGNTRPGGIDIGSGMVLSYSGGAVNAVRDPAISLADAQIATGGTAGKKPIATLELNRIYAVDVYFYLEGCDPDCLSEKVGMDQAALNLAFYGLLAN